MQKSSPSLGIRVRHDAFRRISDADSTRTGVYWFDLRTRYPVGERVKRGIDVVVSIALLTLLAPLILVAIALLRLSSPSAPAILRQRRYGFRCREFTMYRLRTTAGEQCLTPVGRVLRLFGFDGLPQLFNVIKGDMSLVGPRALSAHDLDEFPARSQMRRFSVLPGITGPWRMSGDDPTAEERLALDREYVNRWSLRGDVAILVRSAGLLPHR